MKKLAIVGAGITGLMTALQLHKKYKLTIIDAGPDPRKNIHIFGATYSGMNARHVSYTETAPWTSEYRHSLIQTPSIDGGWLAIPMSKLTAGERKWIEEFQKIAQNKITHKTNTNHVIESNKKGFTLWERIQNQYPFLKPVKDTTVMPIICHNSDDLLSEFGYEQSLDAVCKLYEGQQLLDDLKSLQPHLSDLGNLGYFTLRGLAYYSRDICFEIINYLESAGVVFVWDRIILDLTLFSKDANKADCIVWCTGLSRETTNILRSFEISFGGVIGCWVEIDNPGITLPFKIYGPEPINYINITPRDSSLLMSGGYGFVGIRPYSEAVEYAKPIMQSMIEEVYEWFPNAKITNKAYCIRPATPSGVPTLATYYSVNKIPIVVAVGHSAGGFTQSPYTAHLVEEELKNIHI